MTSDFRQGRVPEPYYSDGQITLYHGNCLTMLDDIEATLMEAHGEVDCIVTDPPYGDTSLVWDRAPNPDWLNAARGVTRQLWCFGSMRFWLTEGQHFPTWWTYGQEIVWEKHNGSSFHADRFKRVHELALHWYRDDWKSLHKNPPVTLDATARAVRRKAVPPHHLGARGKSSYRSEDGGPRLVRSVLRVRSEHGRAVHPTQKPLGILRPLIEYSCPVDGVVLDPFAGSGSTLLAARDMGRRAIGIEVREEYCAATVKRLAQGVMAA